MDNPRVPPRNIFIGYTQKDERKNNEEFGKKIVKLINETIRK